MNTVTRNLISENFKVSNLYENFYDNTFEETTYKNRFVKKINMWKHVLVGQCNAVKGESILIGFTNINTDYLAVCFAAAELSLRIVIVDYSRPDEFKDVEYFDPKTSILSPIDIFLHDIPTRLLDMEPVSRHKFFVNCSKRSYSIVDDIDKVINRSVYRGVRKIFPNPDDILMRCTSSGTTGTPKIVEHSHEFLAKLTDRNKAKFFGKCMHISNLNHGSSLAVYLLPSIASDEVTEHLLYSYNPLQNFAESIKGYETELDFIIFPYPYMIEDFINSSVSFNIKWTMLNVQTLSYIQPIAKTAIKNNTIKSITSIFGSNETSGPVFESSINIDNVDQDSSKFKMVDDFYKIEIYDNNLVGITLPIYNKEIITNDLFEKQGDYYVHKGRTDFIKINGEIVDIKIINQINTDTRFYLVTDSVENCLYLACWEDLSNEEIESYKDSIEDNFERVVVSKIARLEKKQFFSGVKIDNELLREYFRNHV